LIDRVALTPLYEALIDASEDRQLKLGFRQCPITRDSVK
jgi:hypothetical protein